MKRKRKKARRQKTNVASIREAQIKAYRKSGCTDVAVRLDPSPSIQLDKCPSPRTSNAVNSAPRQTQITRLNSHHRRCSSKRCCCLTDGQFITVPSTIRMGSFNTWEFFAPSSGSYPWASTGSVRRRTRT